MSLNASSDKITSVPKKSAKKLHNNNDSETEDVELTTTNRKRYISSKERLQIIDELRLVPIS